jgi:hypothetical protein
MKVALVFNTTRPDTTGGYWERALHGMEVLCDRWALSDLPRLPAAYDLYVRVDHGDDYETPWPDALRPAVFYAIDTHLPHSWRKIKRAAARFDLTFCCHRDGAERLGAEWLPLACDPQLHGAAPEAPAWDVGFVGNDGGVPRKFYLQALRERYPRSFIGAAPHTELAAVYGRSRVGFNYSIANDVNMRMFEVMAAGAPLVTNALRGDELAQLGLEDGTHLLLYRSPREAFRLIDGCLADPGRARSIGEAGRQAVHARHTYAHRMQQFLETVERTLGVAVKDGHASPAGAR